jgi:predicted  nucleic acid-binding Zn-ribbon protein
VKPTAADAARRSAAARDVLTALVKLQDLDLMIREATDPHQADAVSKMGFKTEGVGLLHAARQALASEVEPRLLRIYDAAARRYGGRALVPVTNRTCLGCSAVLPTGLIPDPKRITSCQSCGRILYPL